MNLIVNCETGETTLEEITQEQIEQQKKDEIFIAQEKAKTEAKAAARQAVLDRLGLTQEEAKLLLG